MKERSNKTHRARERRRYAETLPALRALYQARIAQAASVANKIYNLEQEQTARAAEGETPYGKAAGE